MVNRANPNVPSKFKRKANRSKVQKRNAANGVTKNARGTARSSVIHPTSGPAAPLSAKKARKVEKAINHARKRAIEAQLEADGEVAMTGWFSRSIMYSECLLIRVRCTKNYEVKESGKHCRGRKDGARRDRLNSGGCQFIQDGEAARNWAKRSPDCCKALDVVWKLRQMRI
jgi:hypothetical protein